MVYNKILEQSFIGFGLVILYLLGIYTEVHLYSDSNILVPSFVAGGAGLLLLIKNHQGIHFQHVKAIGTLVVIIWFSVLIRTDVFFIERFKGAVQMTYSLLLVYGFFLEVSMWKREQLAKLFYYLCLLIIIGCALENYTSFKALSDSFRVWAFHISDLQHNLSRDISMFGRERPKLFTSEPSHVAKFLLFSITMWLALSEKRRYIQALIISMVGILLIGSPILLLIIPNILVIVVYLEGNGISNLFKRMNMKRLLLYFILALFIVGFLGYALLIVLANRVDSMAGGGEGSTIIRIQAPPLIAFDVIKENPLWGSGITALEMISEITFFHIRELGISYIKDANEATNLITNGFWLHWIQFGLLGGVLIILAIYQIMKTIGVKHYLYCLFLILIFTQTIGGNVTVRFWTYIWGFFLTSVLVASDSRQNGERKLKKLPTKRLVLKKKILAKKFRPKKFRPYER